MNLADKVVMITGASRGIGEAAARLFAENGAKVALLARTEDRIAEIAGEIGPAAIAIPCDVARYWEVEAAIDATIKTFGRLDVLIGNAGIIEPIAHIAEMDPDAWGNVIDVNLKGVFTHAAALPAHESTRAAGRNHTIPPVQPRTHRAALVAELWRPKRRKRMLTAALHTEYAQSGIARSACRPGSVATQMQREIKGSRINRVSHLDLVRPYRRPNCPPRR